MCTIGFDGGRFQLVEISGIINTVDAGHLNDEVAAVATAWKGLGGGLEGLRRRAQRNSGRALEPGTCRDKEDGQHGGQGLIDYGAREPRYEICGSVFVRHTEKLSSNT